MCTLSGAGGPAMNRKTIHSVGIDIGTTTTQVIFSRLTLVNRAPASQVSRYEFVEREIIYQSPVSLTPIDRTDAIDPEALRSFILEQFSSAGLALDDIETGAIIITGETAKAINAREALLDLSQQLGDFVVATAGPHLESRIAGRGSGAAERARMQHQRVMNIDIGGGTSNYAVFLGDRVVDTACLNIGGRLIETDQRGRVVRIHPPARRIVAALFGQQLAEDQLSADHLRRVAGKMADLIVRCARGEPDQLACELLMTPGLEPGAVDALSLSGGVGACYQQLQHEDVGDFTFGDIGVLLARALLQHPGLAAFPVVAAQQTLRATVIGAGAYSLALSGSTIWVNSDALPIRNVPVVHPDIDWLSENPDIVQAVKGAAIRMDLDVADDRYAIALDAGMPAKYRAVQQAAAALAQFYQQYVAGEREALIVVHNDLGKVLGMELQMLVQPRGLVVVDEVDTRDGDYIDIGQPYFGGEIVPLTVKSLAFPA